MIGVIGELPADCIDTTRTLARATVAHWRAAQAEQLPQQPQRQR